MKFLLITISSVFILGSPLSAWSRPLSATPTHPLTQTLLCGQNSPGQVWQRTELLFGLSGPAFKPITPEQFQAFLDQEVTPRFPKGLTLISAYGQYQNAAGSILVEDARVLVLLYPANPQSHQAIEAIRQAYQTQFAQESVLRVDSPACVVF